MFDIIELIEHKHFGSSYTFCCLFIHYLFRVTLITMHYSVISWFSNVSVAPPPPPFCRYTLPQRQHFCSYNTAVRTQQKKKLQNNSFAHPRRVLSPTLGQYFQNRDSETLFCSKSWSVCQRSEVFIYYPSRKTQSIKKTTFLNFVFLVLKKMII